MDIETIPAKFVALAPELTERSRRLWAATDALAWVMTVSRRSNGRPKGVTITPKQMATLNLERHEFHGNWNYTIHPRKKKLN